MLPLPLQRPHRTLARAVSLALVTATLSVVGWSQLAQPASATVVTIPQQTGNNPLTLMPGDTVRAGYRFTHAPGESTKVRDATAVLSVSCVVAGVGLPTQSSITVPIADQDYLDPAPFAGTAPGFVPSNSSSAAITFQGSVTLGNYCGVGGAMVIGGDSSTSGTMGPFTADFYSDVNTSRNVRWHYATATGGGAYAPAQAVIPAPLSSLQADLSVTTTDLFTDPVRGGQPLSYVLTVSNPGTLTDAPNVVVTDVLDPNTTFDSATPLSANCAEAAGTVTCSLGTLDQGATEQITINTTVKSNAPTTTPTGTDPLDGVPGDCLPLVGTYDLCNFASVDSDLGDPDPGNDNYAQPTNVVKAAIELTKEVDTGLDLIGALGEIVTYTFTVKNTGDVTLTDVEIDDTMLGGSVCAPIPDLTPGPGAGSTATCTVDYTVTVDDVESGPVVNWATATGTPPVGMGAPVQSDPDDATIYTAPTPVILLEKTWADADSDGVAVVGEVLTYSFKVTNDGNVTLTDIEIDDPMLDPPVEPWTCLTELAPGDETTCTQPHTVTGLEDVTDGFIDNTATVTATPAAGTPDPVSVTDDASIPFEDPSLTVTPTVTESDPSDGKATEDEVLTYTFAVTNTGNVDLHAVKITDQRAGLTDKPCVATLAVGAGPVTCTIAPPATTTYTVTAADVLAGSVDNLVTATALSPIPSEESVADTKTVSIATGKADIRITKTVDLATAAPGQIVTYEVKVKNHGLGSASNVVVTDPLPYGTSFESAPSCTHFQGTVTCNLGTVTPGATLMRTIKVKMDPLTPANTSHQHHFDYTKGEVHLSVFEGDATETVQCPDGYLATDGSVRLDSVDQGGSFADVVVLESRPTVDGDGWTGTVRNNNEGQSQAKVTVACMTKKTTSGDGHAHPVVITGPVSTSPTSLTFGPGRHTIPLACPTGSYPVRPGYNLTAGEAKVGGRPTTAWPSIHGWEFVVDVDESVTGTFNIHCLSLTTGNESGHTHELMFEEKSESVSVPALSTVTKKLTCPTNKKAVQGWANVSPGLIGLGNDPQEASRVFRFENPTGAALTASVGLLCSSVRTRGNRVPENVPNTATVTTSSVDTPSSPSNDTATAVLVLNPTGVAILTPRAVVATHAGKTTVTLPVKTFGKRKASITLVANDRIKGTGLKAGSVLARSQVKLAKGKAVVRLKSRGPAAKALRSGKITKATLVIISQGRRITQVIKLRR